MAHQTLAASYIFRPASIHAVRQNPAEITIYTNSRAYCTGCFMSQSSAIRDHIARRPAGVSKPHGARRYDPEVMPSRELRQDCKGKELHNGYVLFASAHDILNPPSLMLSIESSLSRTLFTVPVLVLLGDHGMGRLAA